MQSKLGSTSLLRLVGGVAPPTAPLHSYSLSSEKRAAVRSRRRDAVGSTREPCAPLFLLHGCGLAPPAGPRSQARAPPGRGRAVPLGAGLGVDLRPAGRSAVDVCRRRHLPALTENGLLRGCRFTAALQQRPGKWLALALPKAPNSPCHVPCHAAAFLPPAGSSPARAVLPPVATAARTKR
jgi:hypothetical protein